MNLALEILNILDQDTLISISISFSQHSQQHIPSIYLINDGTPASLPPLSRGRNPGNKVLPPATLQVFFITPLRGDQKVLKDSQFLLPVYRNSFDASNLYFLCHRSE